MHSPAVRLSPRTRGRALALFGTVSSSFFRRRDSSLPRWRVSSAFQKLVPVPLKLVHAILTKAYPLSIGGHRVRVRPFVFAMMLRTLVSRLKCSSSGNSTFQLNSSRRASFKMWQNRTLRQSVIAPGCSGHPSSVRFSRNCRINGEAGLAFAPLPLSAAGLVFSCIYTAGYRAPSASRRPYPDGDGRYLGLYFLIRRDRVPRPSFAGAQFFGGTFVPMTSILLAYQTPRSAGMSSLSAMRCGTRCSRAIMR